MRTVSTTDSPIVVAAPTALRFWTSKVVSSAEPKAPVRAVRVSSA